jgi:Lipocalin-like domain
MVVTRDEQQGAHRGNDGTMNGCDGVARQVGSHPGTLKVGFAPTWLAWLPWAWADYCVVDLDADYPWAAVGSPGRKYPFMLSRPRDESSAIEKSQGSCPTAQLPVDTACRGGAIQPTCVSTLTTDWNGVDSPHAACRIRQECNLFVHIPRSGPRQQPDP